MLACTHNLGAFREDYETLTVVVDATVQRRQTRSELESGPGAAYEAVLDEAGPKRGNGF